MGEQWKTKLKKFWKRVTFKGKKIKDEIKLKWLFFKAELKKLEHYGGRIVWKILVGIWGGFKALFTLFLTVLIVGGIGGITYFLYLYNSTHFIVEKLVYYHPPLTARFFDRNGNWLGYRYSLENRIYVKYNQIPGRVIEALLATEDTAFFEHPGINLQAIIRALIKDIKAGKKVEGASTITQQLVRNVYLSRRKTIERKIKEVILALKLERALSKEEILERYLNQVFFGNGFYGIRTASLGYFHKELNQLTLKEIAMLIALPKAPSRYNPVLHYEANIKRANNIIKRLYSLGWIGVEEYRKAILERPKVYKRMMTEKGGWAIDTSIKRLKGKISDLLSGGYDIYLTIDLPTQMLAEEALQWNYRRILEKHPDLNQTLNGAMISIDQATGEVKAIVGGVEYKRFGYNRAYQSARSLGSGIKPFIYSIALNNGYNPATMIPDIPKTYRVKINGEWKLWKPHNYEKNSLGMITLREALVHSRNLATLNLVAMLGLEKIVKGLEKFGFVDFPKNMSIGLGSFGDSVWDFAERYTNISNYGVESKLFIVKRVISQRSGEMVLENNPQHRQSEPPEQAYLMINIMEEVVRRGTGTKAAVKGIEIAGKTGTTNDYRDAWFNGFTPDTETIVWFGNDDYNSLGRGMTGGRVSAPLFAYFYKKLLTIHPELKRHFKVPKEIKKFTLPNGEVEIFTPISPPPDFSNSPVNEGASPFF